MRSSNFSAGLPARGPQLGGLGIVLLAISCAGPARPTRLADGTYRLECESSLSQCLAPMEATCPGHGYDVLEGSEHRARYGPEALHTNVLRAQAKARCRGADPVFGSGAPSPAASSDAAPATLPPPGCVPGASQSCTGLGACSGAQVCAPDGRSYGACDCSPARTPIGMSPDTATPGTTGSGSAAPGTAPNPTGPGPATPGTTTPGTSAPGTATPGTTSSGAAVPSATPSTTTR